MPCPQDLRDLLLLNRLGLAGPKSVHFLLEEGVTPSAVLEKISGENFLNKKAALAEIRESFSAEKEIEEARRRGVRLVTLLDSEYPELLKRIFDPPLVLYIKGSLEALDRAALGVVGTRHPSLYGQTHARKISREMAEKGFTVVSGMAQGIDQAAHQGALDIPHGRTLAILGCGLDKDYPSGSAALREKISERGAVISEYGFGMEPRAENFPKRNRIIAGLSLGILVVEAHSRSGSLITARLAMEEGRDVFALPGPVDQAGSRGTHSLIKEGAYLSENADDILEVLAPQVAAPKISSRPSGLNKPIQPTFETVEPSETVNAEKSVAPAGDEARILKLLSREPLSADQIMEQAGVPVAGLLTLLELRGSIRRNANGSFETALRG